jgi:uncharacterized protein HemX
MAREREGSSSAGVYVAGAVAVVAAVSAGLVYLNYSASVSSKAVEKKAKAEATQKARAKRREERTKNNEARAVRLAEAKEAQAKEDAENEAKLQELIKKIEEVQGKAKEQQLATREKNATAAAAVLEATETDEKGEEAGAPAMPPLEDAPAASAPKASSESKSAEQPTVEDVTAEAPKAAQNGACSLETLLAVFGFMVEGLKQVIGELQAIQMQGEGQVPEEQLMKALSDHYSNSVISLQNQSYSKFSVTEAELEEGAVVHKDNDEFKALLQKMDAITQTITGGVIEPNEDDLKRLPAGFGLDECCGVLNEISGQIVPVMREVLEEVMADSSVTPQTKNIAIADRHTERIEKIRGEVWEKAGLDESSFTAAVLKWQNEAGLIKAHEQLQTNQREAVVLVRAALDDLAKRDTARAVDQID